MDGETHLPPSSRRGRPASSPAQLAVFASRLQAELDRRGLSASDLARKVWGERTDKRGYTVARNRDRVSEYLNGRAIPASGNLVKIAGALGISPDALVPTNALPEPSASLMPETLRIETLPGGECDLILRRRLPLAVALQIAHLVEAKAPPDAA